MKRNNIHIGIVSSKGGHLIEILQIKEVFQNFSHFWVTFKGADTRHHLKGERVYFGYFPESRNKINLLRNFILAFRILKKEKPNIILSCGAGLAIPFFIVGKFAFRAKLIYIESYDFIRYPSLTGKILYNIADLFLVQHRIQKKWYPKAKYWGSLL